MQPIESGIWFYAVAIFNTLFIPGTCILKTKKEGKNLATSFKP